MQLFITTANRQEIRNVDPPRDPSVWTVKDCRDCLHAMSLFIRPVGTQFRYDIARAMTGHGYALSVLVDGDSVVISPLSLPEPVAAEIIADGFAGVDASYRTLNPRG